MNGLQWIIIAVFAFMTVVGFSSMGIDKKRAIKGMWRIKEATLFLIAFLFGGLGTTLGMVVFRHKTKHWYFKIFMPLFAIISICAVVFLLYFFKNFTAF